MEEIIYDDHITLDFDEQRKNQGIDEYRLSVFDKHGHYLDEIFLTEQHLAELYNGLKGLDLKIEQRL